MKRQSSFNTRCSYRTAAANRQCRQLSSDPRSGLCPQHLQKQNEAADLTDPLLLHWQGFQTAQGINFALSNLYQLLAANQISTRRASVLAYINSLLLRTLPQIDSDKLAGIKVPAAFREPQLVPAPTPDSDQPQTPASVSAAEAAPTAEETAQEQPAANHAPTATDKADSPTTAGAADPIPATADLPRAAKSVPSEKGTIPSDDQPAQPRTETTEPSAQNPAATPNTPPSAPPQPTAFRPPTTNLGPRRKRPRSSHWPANIPEPDPTKKPS
jgi:hypothetical protein